MSIEVRNLSFTYSGKERPALERINLKIKKGETILLVGRSGSGKSTLIKCINGLIPNRYQGKYSGEVVVDGVRVRGASLSHLATIVGTVMQEASKQLVMSNVEDDVAFGPCNLCLPLDEVRRRTVEALKGVEALHLRSRDVNELSGGEKQRVAIAGVLALDPQIILLDEPIANLDSEGVRAVQRFIKSFKERGKTVVIAEHRTEEILEVGVDRILVLENGRIVKEAEKPDELREFGQVIKLPASIHVRRIHAASQIPKIPKHKLGGRVAVKLEDVYFSYDGRPAIRGVNLEIREGERVALLGNNGAGKSTLAKLILGILKPSKGRVLIYGMDTREKEVYELARYVGLVFQDPFSMLFASSVEEELSFGPRNLEVPEDEISRRVKEAARKCGISHLLKFSPFASSYGEKKRIAVASILTMLPRILILDEPTAGQDYASYTNFMNFIETLRDKVKVLIIITHDTDLAVEYSDRTVILSDGKIVADGPTRSILASREYLEKGRIRETSLIKIGKSLTGGKYVLRLKELLRYS